MASALKQGSKTWISQLSSWASNFSPPICQRCLNVLHTRAYFQLPLLGHVSFQNACSQPTFCRSDYNLQLSLSIGLGTSVRLKAVVSDPLRTQITLAATEQDLFDTLRGNRTLLDIKYVCSAILQFQTMLKLHIDIDQREKVIKSITENEEFVNLCTIAQHKVSNMTNEELINTMQSFEQFFSGASFHPLVCALFAEGSRRMHSFSIQQLSEFAIFSRRSHPNMLWSLGAISARFSEALDDLGHDNMQILLNLMMATIYTSSAQFQNRVLRKVTGHLQAIVNGKEVLLTGSDITKILTYEWKAYRERSYPVLNDLCCQLLLDQVSLMPTEQLHAINNLFISLKYSNDEFVEAIHAELLKRLPGTTGAEEIGLILEVISHESNENSSVKFLIEDKVKDLLNNHPDAPINSICIALRRIRYRSPTPLIKDLITRIEHAKSLVTLDIVHIVEYFRILKLPFVWTSEMYKSLRNRIRKLQDREFSPLSMVNSFYCMSFLPIETLESSDLNLSGYREILPQLNDRLINLLSLILTRLKYKLMHFPEELDNIQRLLEDVNFQAISNIDQNKSVCHLNNLSQFILEEGGGDVVFLDRAMKQYTERLSQIRNPQMAVKCASILQRAGYLHAPLMDRIAEVITNNIHRVHPSQILGILQPFLHLGYHDPSNADTFFQVCIDRVMPFVDEVEVTNKPNPFFLVLLAYYLSFAQKFPEELLKRIFSLEFLDKFDSTLKDMAQQGKWKVEAEYRRRLMYLNRTMVLECPQLQIPWFHEEYCHKLLQRRSVRLNTIQNELQNVLVEVLGGAQYLRSLVISPYYYDILFEFVLDSDGNPLPVVEFGSILNFADHSSKVMSDLMQWGTQAKMLPKGAQRVAIDYMAPSFYNINSSSLLGGFITKQRQMEILGYRHIQIPYYKWRSSALPEKADKVEYLQRLLFHKNSSLSGPYTILQDDDEHHYSRRNQKTELSQRAVVLQGQKSLGGLDLRVREEDMFDDPMVMRVLKNLTDSTEGRDL